MAAPAPNALAILGIGLELPPAVPVRDYAASKGADVSFYKGWNNVCHVRNDDDQPSTFGSRAFAAALAESGVRKQDIRLLIFTGVSRDYVPSWSVATEVMKLNGMSGEGCVGLDLTIGCLATLSALDLAQGWLALHGGGCAAIVAAERWSHTVDHTDPNVAGMWAWADGGAALIVGMGAGRRAIAEFLGAEFTSDSSGNGYVIIPYGGTRNPVAPPGANPLGRTIGPGRTREQSKAAYLHGYGRAYDAIVERAGVRGERLVMNQMSEGTIGMVAERYAIPMERVVLTGHDYGHMGACDVIIGLERLHRSGRIDAPIALGSSTAYAFGAGLVVPSRASVG
jgi:3-oxoacyl-[acyl-carrier-protein] synthase III